MRFFNGLAYRLQNGLAVFGNMAVADGGKIGYDSNNDGVPDNTYVTFDYTNKFIYFAPLTTNVLRLANGEAQFGCNVRPSSDNVYLSGESALGWKEFHLAPNVCIYDGGTYLSILNSAKTSGRAVYFGDIATNGTHMYPETDYVIEANSYGTARTIGYDVMVNVGGSASQSLIIGDYIKHTLVSGLIAETDGAGGYREPVYKTPYYSDAYLADWSALTLPTPAGLVNGCMFNAFNSTDSSYRHYEYLNSTWVFSYLSADGCVIGDSFEHRSNVILSCRETPGIGKSYGLDIPIAAGGGSGGALVCGFHLDGTHEAGLIAETDGSGGYQETTFKLPYMAGNYQTSNPWDTYTPPNPAGLTNGCMVIAHCNVTGENRIYAYSGGAWTYVALT